MDELDLTSAEAKATYKEIEEWVNSFRYSKDLCCHLRFFC